MSIIIGDVKKVNDKVHGMTTGSGMMECPWCKGYLKPGEYYDPRKQQWKFDRWINPHRARYSCQHPDRKSDHGVQYDM